jgi:ABC-type polysaccharide/polyol phosphate export permease
MTVIDHANFVRTRSIGYASDILRSRRLILELTHREFRSRHLGSALGFIWAFTHPAIMMLIYCLVFIYAWHPKDVAGKPYLIWILAGLVPWFLAADGIGGGASAVTDNRFLVKKVVFRITLLPVVRLLSNLPVHLFLLAAVICIFWARGVPPSWYTLQAIYYLLALLTFCLGCSLLLSAVVPFLKDLGQLVAVILQIAFWVTPLIWHLDHPSALPQTLVFLNPLAYIVEGYRDSLVYHVAFWHHWLITIYFWCVTFTMLLVGGLVFSRLRAHFADVL